MVLLSAIAFTGSAKAQKYWDTTAGAGNGVGGSGTWGTTFSTASTGDATLVAALTTDALIFQGTPGVITLSASQTAASLAFNVTGYKITGSNTTTRTITGAITLASNVTLTVGNGETTDIAIGLGSISGTTGSGLTINGTAAGSAVTRLNLSTGTAPTVSVPITITGNGFASISGGVAGAVVSGTVTGNGARLNLGATSGFSIAFSNTINNGTGNVRFAAGSSGGAGTVLLSGAGNTWGDTEFNAANSGIIRLGVANALPTGTNVTMGFSSGNGGILDLNSFNQEIASLTSGVGGGSITNNNAGTGTSLLKISGSTSLAAFGLNITNGATAKVALERAGTGTTTLAGSGNTYSGSTTISGGTLSIASTGVINATSGLTINGATAVFNYNNTTTAYTGGPITFTQGTISGAGSIGVAVSVGANALLSPGNAGPGTQAFTAGVTLNNGGIYNWEVKSWSATPTAGTDFDQLQISGSNLDISSLSTGAFPANTFKIAIAGLNASNAIGAVSGFNSGIARSWTIATATGISGTFNANAFTLDTASFAANNPLAGGTFSLTTSGSNLLLSFTPGATAFFYWNGGGGGGGNGTWDNLTPNWNSAAAGGGTSGVYTPASTLIFDDNSGTVTVSGTVAPAAGLQFNLTYNLSGGTINLAGPSASINSIATASGVTATIGSVLIGSNGFTKNGDGTLILSNANTYGGTTVLGGGTLRMDNANALSSGNVTFTSGSLKYGTAITTDLSQGRTLTFTSDGIIDTNGNNVTFANAVGNSGAGGLVKNGTGALTLGGANTYLGSTTINGGTVIISADGNLGAAAEAITFAGGTLQPSAAISSARAITVNTGGGTIATGTGNNFSTTGNETINDVLSTTGSGNVNLAGTAMTFGTTGALNIAAGGSMTLSQAAGTITMSNGGVFNGDLILNTSARINLDTTGVTYGGTGKIYLLGSALGAGSGGAIIPAAGFANFNALISNLSATDGGTITSNIVLNPANSGQLTGHVTFAPGDITGANYKTATYLAFIGATTGGKTLTVGDSGHINGVISGEGDLFIGNNSKVGGGAGNLVLNAANTYSGNTLINASGSITLGTNNTLPQATNIVFGNVNGTGNTILDLNGNNQQVASLSDDAAKPTGKNLTITNTSATADSILTINGSVTPGNAFGGVISDGATNKISVVKSGSNTQSFSGTNTYTGTTTVNAGTLKLVSSTSLPSTSSVVLQGGTLALTDGTTIATSGTLKLNGTASIDFGTPATNTTLTFGNSSTTPWAGTLSINGWNGLLTGGGTSQLIVGSDSTGLSATQLAQVNFSGYGLGASILPNGELVPAGVVPEPGTILGLGAAGIGLAGWIRRRRAK
jgi:autotransporter-associated beta strand protein